MDTNADREQANRHPIATVLGEFKGAASPNSLPSKLTAGAGRLAGVARLGEYGRAAIGGTVGAVADAGGHIAGDYLSDKLHGRQPDEHAQPLLKRLGAAALVGGLGGTIGQSMAGMADDFNVYNRSGSSIGRELANAETAGTTTDVVRGLKPAPSVEEAIEKARSNPHGTAVEHATAKVRSPLVAQQEKDLSGAINRIHAEKTSTYERDPGLKKAHGMHETGKELLNTAFDRAQPGQEGFIPFDDLALEKSEPIREAIRRLYKPRLVADVDAAKEAARTGGHVVSLDEAAKAGFKIKGLEAELNPETGIPHNAPSLSDYSQVSESEPMANGNSFPWFPQANPVEVLPKYGKDTLAAHSAEIGGFPGASPEQAAALNKWSFGHDEAIRGVQKGTPDAEIIAKRLEQYGGPIDKLGVPHEQHLAEAREAAVHIAEYLKNTPPATKLPFVYRGLVLSREEAKKFLQQSEFDLGNAASSVSADPAVARSFVARNAKPGDVGLTLKLEHNSARDISPYAADRVKVERELMLPPGSKFGKVSAYEDASNPGNYIVVGKHSPVSGDIGATMPDLGDTPLLRNASGIDIGPPEAPPQGVFTGNAGFDLELQPGAPKKAYRVVLEPKPYDAMTTERQLDAIDRAGKAGKQAEPDPLFRRLMAAGRADRRKNFGDSWADMIERHGDDLKALEQRGVHTGITERAGKYDDLTGNAQIKVNSNVTNYGMAPLETNAHLAELGDAAGVRPDLESVKGIRAYLALKERASPAASMGTTGGGNYLRLGGLLPAAQLRLDAVAKGLARGPDGRPLFPGQQSPGLANTPLGRTLLPSSGLLSLGGGAGGIKTGSVYDAETNRTRPGAVSRQEQEQLERLLSQ
jgi:hypothetical protein